MVFDKLKPTVTTDWRPAKKTKLVKKQDAAN